MPSTTGFFLRLLNLAGPEANISFAEWIVRK
jgi:hypothetical protein